MQEAFSGDDEDESKNENLILYSINKIIIKGHLQSTEAAVFFVPLLIYFWPCRVNCYGLTVGIVVMTMKMSRILSYENMMPYSNSEQPFT